jgi:Secretion system C-terminal sorting domain
LLKKNVKKSTLPFMILGFFILGTGFTGYTQNFSSKHKAAIAVKRPLNLLVSETDAGFGMNPPNVYVSNKSMLDDPITMMTKYDLQSNYSSGQQRIYLYSDGTLGAVATMSHEDGGAYSDRGTGYNYFNGSSWNTEPAARVETTRTGWPSYQPFGPSGEIILAHQVPPLPIKFCTRPVKGTGSWTESTIPIPADVTTMWWPRMVTNGPDHTNIHVIAMTLPTGNGGTTYNGMDGALLYINSLDGGSTWSDWQQLDGMTFADYINFTADTYSWAQPQGNIIAFTVGDMWKDQFLMKSTDNGTTWTKTVIWPCPYNLWAGSDDVPDFRDPDGTMHVALDQQGMAHVVFGLQQGGATAGVKHWTINVDGLVYWNEYMSPLQAVLDWDTLVKHGNLIGWVLDKDSIAFYHSDSIAWYQTSMTSNPGITIDADNNMFVIWSGLTSRLDANSFFLRHIFERTATIQSDHAIIWGDSLTDLTGDFLQYNWTECAYPDIAANSDSKIYVLFQGDELAGSYVKGTTWTGYMGQTSVTENNMIVLNPNKTDLYVGTADKKEIKPSFAVSENYPNPVIDLTTVNVNIQKPGNLILEVTNLMGQNLITMEKVNLTSGNYRFVIDGSQLAPGVYFYMVKLNNESITNKMIVE